MKAARNKPKKMTGFAASRAVRAKLQAALYHNRRRRVDRQGG